MLRIASAKTYSILRIIFFVVLAPSLICLILLVYFSFRWGRVVSPAIVTIWVAIPGTILMTFLSIIKPPSINPNNPGPLGRYAPIATEILPIISKVGLQIYLSVFVIGLVLLITAFVGSKILKKKV